MHARRRIETGLGVTVTPFASAREACYRWGVEGETVRRCAVSHSRPDNVIDCCRAALAPCSSPSTSGPEGQRGAPLRLPPASMAGAQA